MGPKHASTEPRAGATLRPKCVASARGLANGGENPIRLSGTLLQLMLSQLKGVGWAAMISVGLHGALAWAVLRAPLGRIAARPRATESITVDIIDATEPLPDEPIDPPRDPPPAIVEEPPPEPEVPTRPAAVVRPPGLPERPSERVEERDPGPRQPDPVSTIDVPEVELREPTTEPEETPEERRRRLAALIDPRNAARSSFSASGPGPSRRGPPAGRGTGSDRGPSEAEMERSLQASLRAEALTKSHLTRERVEPRRQPDGSYAWSGHAFSARINRDGSVDFDDRPNVQTNGFSTSGSLDLTDAIMGSQGQDPYLAERERFMRETRELRERLEAEHRAETMASALRRLRGRLSQIWNTTSRSEAARRERIFRIWDDIAEDSSGVEARRIVLSFIREVLPENSEHAYTEAELERFNRARQSRERFEPY